MASWTLPPQPPDAVIHVHTATSDQLVLDIPPGKNSGGLGLFAVLWNGFMGVFTALVIFAYTQQKAQHAGVYFLLFLGLFWLIGFGIISAWLKLRFERCFLLVDRNRAVLRRMLFGRQRQTAIELDEASRAHLTESYRENERPVYRITLTGSAGKVLHFGTSLAGNEKDWCVDAINALIRPQAVPSARSAQTTFCDCEACGETIPPEAFRTDEGLVICPACEHQQPGPQESPVLPNISTELQEVLDATPLPIDPPVSITLQTESPELLAFTTLWSDQASTRRVTAFIVGVIAAVWTGISWSQVFSLVMGQRQQMVNNPVGFWVPIIFLTPFLIADLAIWLGVLAALRGRLTTRIDPETVRLRFHVGPFGKTWTAAVRDITAIRLTSIKDLPSRAGNPRVSATNVRVADGSGNMVSAAIFAGARVLTMTAMHEPLTARYVVEKVKAWLRQYAPSAHVD